MITRLKFRDLFSEGHRGSLEITRRQAGACNYSTIRIQLYSLYSRKAISLVKDGRLTRPVLL